MLENISGSVVSHSLAESKSSLIVPQLCKICGAIALHSNYGALTCDSCKIFFRRNANKEQSNCRCHYTGNCEINIYNRHICTYCRLAKCFENRMQTYLIRSPRSNQKIIKKDQPQQLTTLNLLQSDNSTLDSIQWTLLSNVTNSYDERTLVSIAHRFMNETDNSQSLTTIDLTLPKEFFLNVYETTGKYLRTNLNLCTMSSEDRSDSLRIVGESVASIGAVYSWNWSQLDSYKPFLLAFKKIYGDSMLPTVCHLFKFIDPDIIVAKLALSLFAFSNNITIFSLHMTIKPFNTLPIFHIQNLYAEVTWKYLLYKYGYYQSIQRFTNLIQCLLAATNMVADARNIPKHLEDITSLVEQIELSLILDDMEHAEEE